MFAGAHTALVTPFLENGTIDTNAYRTILNNQFENGISGVVPVGTTGESPTLSHEEHIRVIQIAVKETAGRGHIIAGTGSNSTAEAIALTQSAEEAGATASLQVTPYYNKPSQEGLFQHFRAIAESTDLPIMLYSIPGRSVISIEIETVVRLAEACPNIRSIKEAGGDINRVIDLKKADLPDDFEILSGDDGLTFPFMKEGAVGIVSVASNLMPKVLADMTKAMLDGDIAKAEAIHNQFEPVFKNLLSLDTNPAPIKAALALKGLCLPKLRLPLVEMSEDKVEQLKGLVASLES